MNVSVKRINKKELEQVKEDKEAEGYKLSTETDRQLTFEKKNYGSALWHIVIFIATIWWTAGVGNLLYLAYAYFKNSEQLVVKVK